MTKLFDKANEYLKSCNWRDMALLKFCLFSMGVLVGTHISCKNKKVANIISGIVFINNTFLYMQKIINKIRILNYVGLHSMSFYTSHWVVIMSSLLLYNNILGLDKIWTLLCTVFSCITVLPFISNLKVSR